MGLFDFLKGGGETGAEAARRLYDSATRQYEAKNYEAAVRLYESAWEKNPDVDTFFPLSVCYFYGWGTAKDEPRCYELTRHAAMKDVPGAMSNLSFLLNTGYGCAVDRTEARQWLEKSAATGFLDARYTLALQQHDEVAVNPPLLHQCYLNLKACADKGHKDAPRLMSDWFGPVTAEEWKGLTTVGMTNRGYDWMTGSNGFDKNPTLAMRCLRAAAEQGSAAAWCNIGWLLDDEGRHAEANEAYLKGANLGNTTAMLNLARNLHIGRGWPRDDDGARRYLTMAHEAGDSRALERMAEFFPKPSSEIPHNDENNDGFGGHEAFDGCEGFGGHDGFDDYDGSNDYEGSEDGCDCYDGDDEEVQFMLDNMDECLLEDFGSDEYDVEAKARQLIDDDDWPTARLLLESCLAKAGEYEFCFTFADDIKALLAWVYYNDGDGTDGTDEAGVEKDTEWYRTRLAHSLVVDIPDDFVSCNDNDGETEMHLAAILYNCFCLYDDFEISGLPGSRPRQWYGRRAYGYYEEAARCGFYFAMYRQAQFLLAGDVVPRDYNRAKNLYDHCKDHIDTSLYRLGEQFT